MQVDQALVMRIARLARIKISEEEATSLQGELSGILDWVEQLSELDTDDVEPMTRVVPIELPRREDVVSDGQIAEKVLANAPFSEDDFFVVPKIVE